ncbi:ABC transporter permease [Salininema proteolyticum]|uniref:ABC transporter permease n=1 Tax=Salininema proteolyticum TaxID=1607685 RepID=A0ABV8TVT3_9ACTN
MTEPKKNSSFRGIGLVAAREVRVRGLSKSNIIALVVTVAAVALLALLPNLFSGDDSYTVGVAGENSQAMAAALEQSDDPEIEVEQYGSVDEAEQAVKDEDVEAAVTDTDLIVNNGVGQTLQLVLTSVHQSVASAAQLEAQGLDPAQVAEAMSVPPLNEVDVSTSGGWSGVSYFFGLFVSLFMMFMIMMPVQYIAMGVIEEKSSRIVEILLTTLRPWQLLIGKILGLGVVSVVTMVAVVITGLTAAAFSGALPDMPDGTAGVLFSTLGWWVLGFALFGSLAGGVGAMVSRQEEAGAVLTPITLLIIAAYMGTNISVLTDPDSGLSQAMSMIPPFSAIAMPARTAMTSVPMWEVAVAVAGLALAAVGAIALGATIYRRTVLHVGSRLKFSDVFKREAAA